MVKATGKLLSLFMVANIFAALPIFAATFQKPSAQKSDISFIRNAESMMWDKNDDSLHMKGNVQIIYQGQHFSCDEAIYNMKTKIMEAKGSVIFRTSQVYAEADTMSVNFNDNTGILNNGFVQSGQVSFEGKTIYRKGDNEFEVIEGHYTACTTCPPAWSFSGSKVKANFGGYARIKNPILRVANFPIFWMPYLIVPLKSSRQSGFLFPSFGYEGDSGATFSESFFWAISPSQDATFTAKNYSHRGIKSLANYRYILSENSRGEADFSMLQDKLFSGDPRVTCPSDNLANCQGNEGKLLTRWGGKYKHYYTLPGNYIHRTNLYLSRDLYYSKDFPDEFPFWGDSAIENKTSITKNTEKTHTSLDVNYNVNILNSNPMAQNTDAVHKFPHLRHQVTDTPIADTNLLFRLDTEYVNFSRDSYVYDKISPTSQLGNDGNYYSTVINPSGNYNPKVDQIRAGQRMDITPALSYPFTVGPYLDVLPSISFRETDYQFSIGENPSAQRQFVKERVSGRTHFSAVFGDLLDYKGDRFKHEMEPEIVYTNIPVYYRSKHPFFGPSDQDAYYRQDQALTDGDLIQFDYNDRITERNLLSFVYTNKLTAKTWSGDQANYRQIALWRLAQNYDFYEETRTDTQAKQVWSDVSSFLDIRLKNFETYSQINYYPYERVTNSDSRVKLIDDKDNFLQLAFAQKFKITRGIPINYDTRTEDYTFTVGTTKQYFTLSGSTNYSTVTNRMKSYQYVVTVRPPGNCWSFSWYHVWLLGDKPDYGFSFGLSYDGKNEVSVKSPKLNNINSL